MFNRLSTLNKFFIPTATIFVVLTVAAIYLSANLIRSTFIDRIKLDVAKAVQSEAKYLTPEDFSSIDPIKTKSVFDQLFAKLKTSEIIRIKVWDTSAKIIYSDDPSIINKSFPDNEEFREGISGKVVADIEKQSTKAENVSEQQYTEFLEVYVPITFPGKSFVPGGVIETYYKLDNVNLQIRQTQMILTLSLIIFSLIIFVLLYIFFNRVIYRPITQLKNAAGRITNGDFSQRVKVESQDELGMLSTSFNTMAEKVKTFYEDLEAKVKERSELLSKVIDTNPNLIMVKDHDGHFVMVNQAVANFYESRTSDLIGKIKPEFNAPEEQIGNRWFQTISVPLTTDSQQKLIIATDITDQKQADDLKNKFIKIVSHQLRTPLSSIRWNLELILGGRAGSLEKGQEDLLRMAFEADKIVISRIDDLLTVLDIEEGKIHLEKEPIQLENLTQSVFENFKNDLDLKKIKGNLETPSEKLPSVNVDINKIRSAIEKLLDNAVTYSKDGGEITIKIYRQDSLIHFEIQDNGIGIPQTEQEKIFKRFHRSSNAFTAKPDASGLGLFIAKSFIEAHGGTIGFTSVENQGSTFWFNLPTY